MKSKEIRELINFIANSGLDEVNLETEEIKLHIKKQSAPVYVEASAPVAPQQVAAAPVAPAAPVTTPVVETSADSTPADGGADESNYITIKSPMIGTFYRASNPESPVFASIGDTVAQGQVVCIIEAMKLFNEIESEISGKIVKVLVENATPVEYDQPLFLVDPS